MTSLRQSPSSSKLIDWQQAGDAVAGEVAALEEVATAALQEFPELLETLEQSLSQQDFDTSRRAAHTIKSSSRILCASKVIDLSVEAEDAATACDASRVHAAARELRGMIYQVSQEIDAFLHESERKH